MTIKQSWPAIAATGLRKSFGDQVVLAGEDTGRQERAV
jgi:ABC-2 type transport system ATP-binding protein